MAGKVFLLNGFPTSLVENAYNQGFNGVLVIRLDSEKLRRVLDGASEVINAIRHESTKNLVLSLVSNKNKIREQLIVDFNNISKGDYIVVIAPRSVQQRGIELSVTFNDLSIFLVRFVNVGLDDVYDVFP